MTVPIFFWNSIQINAEGVVPIVTVIAEQQDVRIFVAATNLASDVWLGHCHHCRISDFQLAMFDFALGPFPCALRCD